jgi:hypothetical protein
MTEFNEKKLRRLRVILRGKPKKEIAEKHNCSVEHVRNVLLGYRENEEILLSCFEVAQRILKEQKEKNKKLSKIKL